MPHPHERAHYRIEYPPKARLRFVADGGRVWPVDNCSELGFRYQTAEAPLAEGELPEPEARVSGRIEFHDGALVAVTGTVVRVTGGDVVVRLDSPGIPLPVIWAEQRYLRNRSPGCRRAGSREKESGGRGVAVTRCPAGVVGLVCSPGQVCRGGRTSWRAPDGGRYPQRRPAG